MSYDSNRRALHSGLPWIFYGYLSMAAGLLLWVVARLGSEGPPLLEVVGRILGALGSGLFLIGCLQLARARIAARSSLWLPLAFLFWLAEFVFRLQSSMLASGTAFSGTAPSAQPELWIALRMVVAAASLTCLSAGMLWIWDRRPPPILRRRWTLARRLFALQLAACLALVFAGPGSNLAQLVAGAGSSEGLLGKLWMPLVWIVFAGPYAQLYFCLTSTRRALARRETLTELIYR